MKNYEEPFLEIRLFCEDVVRCSTVNDNSSGADWADPFA